MTAPAQQALQLLAELDASARIGHEDYVRLRDVLTGPASADDAVERAALGEVCTQAMQDAMNTYGPFSGRRQGEYIADRVRAALAAARAGEGSRSAVLREAAQIVYRTPQTNDDQSEVITAAADALLAAAQRGGEAAAREALALASALGREGLVEDGMDLRDAVAVIRRHLAARGDAAPMAVDREALAQAEATRYAQAHAESLEQDTALIGAPARGFHDGFRAARGDAAPSDPTAAELADVANRAQEVTGGSVWPSTVRAVLRAWREVRP